MITIQVSGYEQFKAVVSMLGKGRPSPHLVYVEDTVGFTVAAFVDNAVVSAAHKFDAKPPTFNADFPNAVAIAGIGWS